MRTTTLHLVLGIWTIALVTSAPATAAGDYVDLGSPGVIRLEIDSNNSSVEVYSIAPPRILPLCRVPCDKLVDVRSNYRLFFGGEGITASSELDLRDKRGNVNIRVNAGDRHLGAAGLWFTSIGTSAAVLGAFGVALQLIRDGTPRVPASVAGVGGAMLAVGLPLYFIGRTTFDFVPVEKGTSRFAVGPGGVAIQF